MGLGQNGIVARKRSAKTELVASRNLTKTEFKENKTWRMLVKTEFGKNGTFQKQNFGPKWN